MDVIDVRFCVPNILGEKCDILSSRGHVFCNFRRGRALLQDGRDHCLRTVVDIVDHADHVL